MSRKLDLLLSIYVLAIVLAVLGQMSVLADGPDDHGDRDHWPVYQRHAFDWMNKAGHDQQHGGHRRGRFPVYAPQAVAQVSSGWFQRPYPYHLDYYKMRYGGSYAPYFGNLYGPPQVVTAPPYYGPYYGGYEYGHPNVSGPTSAYPGFPNGAVYGAPVEDSVPKDQPATVPDGDNLPAP
ncbi:MAG: hypothetical protein WD738_10755 [Pirellulales bacterium]